MSLIFICFDMIQIFEEMRSFFVPSVSWEARAIEINLFSEVKNAEIVTPYSTDFTIFRYTMTFLALISY